MADFNTVLDEGIKLFRCGFFAIPCPQYKKHPTFLAWNSMTAVDIDDYVNQIEELSQQYAWRGYDRRNLQWNFAVTCNDIGGNGGLFVLDIDNKLVDERYDYYRDKNGQVPMGDSLLEYVEERVDIRDCPLSKTKSGGYHIYFRSGNIDWSKYKQGQRLEGPDGVLLLDGRNPLKGCAIEYPTYGYEWIRRPKPIHELPTVPETILQWIPPQEEEAVKTPSSAYKGGYKTRQLDYSDMRRIDGIESNEDRALLSATLDYIDQYCPMIEHERNHYLNKVAITVYHRAGFSMEITRSIVEEWAKAAWGMTGENVPWDEVETRLKGLLTYQPKKEVVGMLRRQLGLQ